jgi:hypothetical protein
VHLAQVNRAYFSNKVGMELVECQSHGSIVLSLVNLGERYDFPFTVSTKKREKVAFFLVNIKKRRYEVG